MYPFALFVLQAECAMVISIRDQTVTRELARLDRKTTFETKINRREANNMLLICTRFAARVSRYTLCI